LTQSKTVIRTAVAADTVEMSKLLGDVFHRRDPPAVATGFSSAKLERVVAIFGAKSAGEGLSVVAVDPGTSEVVGAVLAHDFGTPPPGEIEGVDLSTEPVIALLDGLENHFLRKQDVVPSKFLHIFMIGVRDDHSGKRISYQLLEACLKGAGERGFRRAITEATNHISQGVFRRIGFTETYLVRYEDFEFMGQKPFETIRDQRGCALMEMDIA
jgi:ribosomal protein S18 acetylase RimI-like enzyme